MRGNHATLAKEDTMQVFRTINKMLDVTVNTATDVLTVVSTLSNAGKRYAEDIDSGVANDIQCNNNARTVQLESSIVDTEFALKTIHAAHAKRMAAFD